MNAPPAPSLEKDTLAAPRPVGGVKTTTGSHGTPRARACRVDALGFDRASVGAPGQERAAGAVGANAAIECAREVRFTVTPLVPHRIVPVLSIAWARTGEGGDVVFHANTAPQRPSEVPTIPAGCRRLS